MKQQLTNLKIRTKLIILFVFIKVIPLLILATITLFGIYSLYDFFMDNTNKLKQTTKEVVTSTANIAVEDSILALDRKTQESLEKMTNSIASSVADFLYERDDDLLFLASIPHDQQTYANFMKSKNKPIIKNQSDNYRYDESTSLWVQKNKLGKEVIHKKAELSDNAREFNQIDPIRYDMEVFPLYKEVTFIDLYGMEQTKISSLDPQKHDISIQSNTYVNSETYFSEIQSLKEGEIYVSDVIGAYVPSQIIGTFTREKANKAGIPFEPEKHGYAGKENPKGKRFNGIIRFVTPVYKDNQKIGYVSLALDHRHIMAFTDTVNPLGYSSMDVSDGSVGNYAFMWDYKGRSISHVRDYFINGFDPQTGQRAAPWLSSEVEEAFVASKVRNLNDFLKGYPTFDDQSLKKRPSKTGIQKGLLGLDCRYLNFAPQCQGWMQLTKNGGLGSFIIFWSNVWKLSTAATIPYYTGNYGLTPRGFGFITMGANVDEFHKAAYKTKENLDQILVEQLHNIDHVVTKTETRTKKEIDFLVNELTISTLIMIVVMIIVAIWLSNLLRQRLQELIIGAKEFTKNNLSYRIQVDSKDEIGMLSDSFNNMANAIQDHMQKEKELNQSLEKRIKERTQQLHQQAYFDPLTKLANRALGYDRLEHAIINAKANNSHVAVLFLDLDKFKQVNDTMGHDVGDMLLYQVGQRLLNVCHETDTICRLGGDEFLIILEGISLYEDAIHEVEKIIDALATPFNLNDMIIHTSTSVGITFYPEDGDSVQRLLKNSDIAMYRAKAKGRSVYEIFTEDLGKHVQETVMLEQALRDAVNNKEFIMHYQPIISLEERKIIGFEALMRWQHEEALKYPNAFIETLENTKLIIDATENLMTEIFDYIALLNQRYNETYVVAVNISATHFALDDFCDRLKRLTSLSSLDASQVCLEVTETIFLEEIEIVSRKLKELKQSGFRVSLDDFGTGYSSLNYLKKLPLNKIKIDRSFIKELPASIGDAAITSSVCSWGKSLQMQVVAEGVETVEQLEFLEQAGCGNIQGYLFAKPMDKSSLQEYLDRGLIWPSSK